uniref:Farnesyl pyrophosphate synthase n=1 Tax=Florenciella parvula TaxID=236787 RepID=A0A7S2BBN6_9STRA|mmetsp:Transcript_15220/g.31884  ORF Transcript_15220/g.31884 Transcript_15220/m.31884 type:complete len:410 (+) Transcript_15220:34-1263(+)|eukprot:CAMPEP_0182541394 /NCGR_PEP_ID=MMETSP1323-20130603/28574_1 /TAXON_ID=236787 /ORGANISM="Florenciella parvula, Strain RCC1693" /LENGTH=409 /DNA_ID=CAMNT_0024752143 /DNA_START=28 /DNA_END=1257 /DNA_ORIENTATION=+
MASSKNSLLVGAAGLVVGAGIGYAAACMMGEKKDEKKKKASATCPATEWPQGKPVYTASYPAYDLADQDASFMRVGDMLIEEILSELPRGYEMPPREVKWIEEMLHYNVKGGKMNRGKMVVASMIELAKHQGIELSPTDISKYAVLGWCVEWMQAWLLMADDVMDDSQTRRGHPCWYKLDKVQKIAINDAFTVEMLVFKLLKRHFGQETYYLQLLDLFLETTFQTECGQLLDTLCMNLTVEDFSVERWTLIVKYKTAFYSFYASVAMAMVVFGIEDREAYDAAREVLMVMGIYFQAQDDFLDCYGTPEQIGKIGTDIQDKKCGWLFCQAYHHIASPEQKAVLKENYGHWDDAKVEVVKQLYRDMDLETLYRAYEEESYKEIMAMKPKVEALLPWSIFEIFLGKVYKRSK